MEKFRQIKQALIWLLIAVVALKVVLWVIEPLVPLILALLVFVMVFGVLVFRRRL